MKKLVAVIASVLLALTICLTAAADTAAEVLYDKAADLLFHTGNVTLSATVDFSLDGEWFKTAEGVWKQDYSRSCRQLLLKSPKADGSERRNGYTIVTDDDKLYLMEVFTPGICRTGTTAKRNAILRSTVETEQLIRLGRVLAGQAGLLLGEGAVTQTQAGEVRLELDENAPPLVNAGLNQVARFAAKRYFDVDYDTIGADDSMSVYGLTLSSFPTLTESLLYAMRSVSLRKAEITVSTDPSGEISHAEGAVCLYVETARDGVHLLDIGFRADVSDRGSTLVKKFEPDDYGVAFADDEADGGPEGGEVPWDGEQGTNTETEDAILLQAVKIWPETGFDMTATTDIGLEQSGNVYHVILEGADGIRKHTFFSSEGRFTGIHAEPNDWQSVSISQYTYDPVPDEELDRKAKDCLMDFLKKFSPEMLDTVKELKMEWIYETNGAVYAQYNEYPLEQEEDGVLFVIRISPDMRIEYYSCVSNG